MASPLFFPLILEDNFDRGKTKRISPPLSEKSGLK